jgi:hypothetical protein
MKSLPRILTLSASILLPTVAAAATQPANVIASAAATAITSPQLVRLTALHETQVQHLRELGVDFATEHPLANGDVDILVTSAQRRYLADLGYDGVTLIEDVQAYFDREVNADGDMGAYHTYDEMLTELEQVAADHPEIARLHNLGPSWETVNKGDDRYIWALKISDQPDQEEANEADVLFIGNTHAREVITVEIPLALIHELTDGYGSDPTITAWVDSREIWVIPMVNPDGHHTVENRNASWRKNRNRNGSNMAFQWGVDLNRNWSYKWGFDEIGSSSFRFMETYRGTDPLSEPESQAIAAFVAEHDFVFSYSYHSYGDLFLYTWSYKRLNTPDHDLLYAIGNEATRYNGYLDGNPKSGAIYTANGEWDDFMYGERTQGKAKTFSFTIEVGGAFWPDESQIPALIDENIYPQHLVLQLADYPWAILGNRMSVTGVPETLAPGSTLVADVSLTNTSGSPQSYQLWSSAEVEGEVVRQPLAPIQEVTLADGATEETQISVEVPLNTPTGDYDFVVEIGSYPDGHVGQVIRHVTVE